MCGFNALPPPSRYAGLWVGSNGYITFEEPDNARKAGWDEHFSQPRISLLFADLKPNLKSGSVKYTFQPADRPNRVVVTYDHLHDYCTWYAAVCTYDHSPCSLTHTHNFPLKFSLRDVT